MNERDAGDAVNWLVQIMKVKAKRLSLEHASYAKVAVAFNWSETLEFGGGVTLTV